jgi:diguanylate cyclase (GGDEF)-like protein
MHAGSSAVWLVVLPVAFLAAEVFVVHVRIGRDAFAFSLMEVPLVLGLFFVRPDLLVACRLVGALLAFVYQRKAIQKAVFNAAMFALETSVAETCWHLVLQHADPLGPRGWLATGVAALATSVLNTSLVSSAITVASGERPRSLTEVYSLGQLGDLANACFALIAVYIISVDWRAGWLLGVVTVVLFFAYRSYEGLRSKSESLEQVNRFTEVIGGEVDPDVLVADVLAEIQTAFGVEEVAVRMAGGSAPARDLTRRGGTARTSAPLLDVLAPHSGGGLLIRRHSREPRLAALARAAGVRDAMVVQMRSEGRQVGSLAVADRLGDVTTFRDADLRRLQAFANHAAVAVDNAARAHQLIRQAEEREHAALHDDLTGLPHRRLLVRRLGAALSAGGASVLLLGVDDFKNVNDTLGHEIGDRLLALVGQRLREAATPTSTVARLDGDEFCVLLPGAGELDAQACASWVRSVLDRPFVLDGVVVATQASVGVTVATAGQDPSTVLRWGDIAMDAARARRTGLEVYRPELDRRDARRLGLLADLRTAIAGNAITVHYQPKMNVETGAVEGVEALARWRHEQHGAVGPDEFIPLAEHSSLITPLTMLVLRTALSDCARWQEAAAGFGVAVNISPRSLVDPSFVDEVVRALALVAVPASALTLEITETSLMEDPERAMAALDRLRAVGVRLSVDDLGTGYSSLAYLQRLPVDEVKIDRSFFATYAEPSSQAVIGAIVDLGHRLGRKVVAEGIEDEAAFDLLRLLGCDTAQGWWIGRPMPADDLARFLAAHPPRPRVALRRVQ